MLKIESKLLKKCKRCKQIFCWEAALLKRPLVEVVVVA
jgi:hypothetical protein